MDTTQIPVLALSWTETVTRWLVTSGAAIVALLVLAALGARFFRSGIAALREKLEQNANRAAGAESPESIRKRIATLTGLLSSVGTVVIWAVVLITILMELGIEVGPILASAGIAGLAVGFGAQNLVRDVISGFFLLLEDQVHVGDVAVINGTGGLVENIGLRTIVLRDQAGTVHVFPNGTVTTLANLTKGWSAAVYEIGVAYREDTDRVAGIMERTAEELRSDPEYADRIIEPLEILGVDAFEDSAVIIKARQKTKPIEQWSVGREYRRRLKKAFEREGVEIPFPQRTITGSGEEKPFPVRVREGGSGP